MMDTAKQEQRHLERFVASEREGEFGISYIQRFCQIGYNNACHVAERGISNGSLVRGSQPWKYRIARNSSGASHE